MKHIVVSEWRKLTTYPLCVFALCGIVVGIPVLNFVFYHNLDVDTDQISTAILRALQAGQVFVIIMAAAISGQEYADSVLRTSMLCCPDRPRLFRVKILLIVATTVGSFLTAFVVMGIMALFLSGNADTSLSSLWPLGVVRCLLSWIGLAVLTGCLSIVFRSAIVPVVIFVPLILGVSQILMSIITPMRVLPDLATARVFLPDINGTFLDPTLGLVVQWAWAAPAVIAAAWLHQRRDVR